MTQTSNMARTAASFFLNPLALRTLIAVTQEALRIVVGA